MKSMDIIKILLLISTSLFAEDYLDENREVVDLFIDYMQDVELEASAYLDNMGYINIDASWNDGESYMPVMIAPDEHEYEATLTKVVKLLGTEDEAGIVFVIKGEDVTKQFNEIVKLYPALIYYEDIYLFILTIGIKGDHSLVTVSFK